MQENLYFCFSVPSLEDTDYAINDNDNENTRWIKDQELQLFEKAKSLDIAIVFNRQDKKFYHNNKAIDVKGVKIFPRAFIPYEHELIENLEKSQANSIQTSSSRKKIIAWPKYIQPEHREVIFTTFKDFKENADKLKQLYPKIFFKTAEKSHSSGVLKTYGNMGFMGQNLFYSKPPIFNVKDDDEIMLSEVFEAIDDKENNMDCREYRVFVVDNKIHALSRSYVDYSTKVPARVTKYANSLVDKVKKLKVFASSYVVDLAEMEIHGKEVIDIVEFNPICVAGLEVDNNLTIEFEANNASEMS